MKRLLSSGVLAFTLAVMPAMCATVFQDDFSADSAGLAKTSLVNWNLLNGTNVDVGGFGSLCGPSPAQCIDSQGSSGLSDADIQTKSSFALGPGFTYDFHYTLNNAGTSSVLLTIGTFTQLINPAVDGTYDILFTLLTNQTVPIRLTDQGPADNVGLYIGHIVLSSSGGSSVPEPATIGMATIGCGMLVLLRRRNLRRNN